MRPDERYRVEHDRYLTQCDCPPSLCTHPDGDREVWHWQVWDVERDDYADGGDEFKTKRSAKAHRDSLIMRDVAAAEPDMSAEADRPTTSPAVIQRRVARSTGTVVEVWDLAQPDAELERDRQAVEYDVDGNVTKWDEGDRFVTFCDEHKTLVTHRTRKLAMLHASTPFDWCEECVER